MVGWCQLGGMGFLSFGGEREVFVGRVEVEIVDWCRLWMSFGNVIMKEKSGSPWKLKLSWNR